MLRRLIISAFAVFMSQSFGAASERVALVIGNGDYRNAVALPNPKNDAEDVAAMLETLGFEVIKGIDLDRQGMEATLRQFAGAVTDAKISLFFYAGHGIQVNGRNYLIPVDAKLEDRTALDFETIESGKVFRYMTGGDKVALAFLDACRNNPLTRRFVRSLGQASRSAVGRGLAAPTVADSGLFIAFATAPNDVAQDGEGRNSPFTSALISHMPTPGLEIQQVMTRVKADVQTKTNGDQRPWHNSDLSSEVYLLPGSDPPSTPGPVTQPPTTDPDGDALAVELAYWDSVKGSNNKSLLEAYLQKYPDGRFADLAETMIATLNRPDPPKDTRPQVPVREQASYWDHNGSLMQLVSNGSQRQFVYVEPRSVLASAGVRAGTVLFDGRRVGQRYVGTARVFSRFCTEPLEYQAEGAVVSEREVVLTGTRPVFKRCQPTGEYSKDRLVFRYKYSN